MVLELEDVWLRSEKTLALPKVKKHKVLTDFEIRGKKAVVAGKERGESRENWVQCRPRESEPKEENK